MYCYANANKATAQKAFTTHDAGSAFLGFSKSRSEMWLAEMTGVEGIVP